MGKKLMIVDDSRVVHATMKKLLENSGYDIIGFCRSGEDALESYREHRPDIVTMDIVMPGIDGFETSKEILKEFPDARIVMVSSLAYDDTIEAAEKLGAKGFIFKPFEQENIIAALDKAMAE